MAEHLETGKQGEEKAKEFLLAKGYEILLANYRYRHAEIDLIARKDKILIFVEVKTRSNTSYGMPEEFVDATKRKLIMKAAENYIFDTDWHGDIRFDVISVILGQNNSKIYHIQDAFY